MNPQETIKRKNDLMKSIMNHPRLSKSFGDALKSPIGSTKRDQARSTFSIISKVGGIKHDGSGGPMPMSGMPMQNTAPQSPSTPNYGNMMIFPAAPKLKSTPKQSTQTATSTQDGKGGIFDSLNTMTGSTPNMSSPSNYQGLKFPSLNMSSFGSTPAAPIQSIPPATTPGNLAPAIGSSNYSPLTLPNLSPTSPQTTWPSITKPVTPTTTPATPTLGTQTTTLNGVTYNSAGDVITPAAKGPVTSTTGTQTGTTETQTQGTTPVISGGLPTPPGGTYASPTVAGAQAAVNSGLGSVNYAYSVADAKFGGSLDQYMANLNTSLKNQFNLPALETQLNSLKDQRANLIPTLQQYMAGKDQYLTMVNDLISKTEDEWYKANTADPATASSYKNYLDTLYTLKGRQNTRYANFLNAAATNYTADLTSLTNNYNTVYGQYTSAMTQQGGMAQNSYNQLVARMSDLYTSLENAPIKAANAAILQKQLIAANLSTVGNGLDAGNSPVINPDYYKDIPVYINQMAKKDANDNFILDTTILPTNGLVGLYKQNNLQGGDERPMTEAIRRVLSTTLSVDKSPQMIATVKKLVLDLANDAEPAGAIFAQAIAPTVTSAVKSATESYALTNIAAIKSAAKDLVSGYGGILGLGSKKSGLEDKTSWMAAHSSLDKNFLESLYTAISTNVAPGTAYAADPISYINQLFSGKTDDENAKNIAERIAVSS